MTQERVPVLLVGAGAAGLTLSLVLLQQGILSLLVERRTVPDWHPRTQPQFPHAGSLPYARHRAEGDRSGSALHTHLSHEKLG
ncbi:MAG TPA: FAD-dependent monooxygenase [Ktedonobacteraceae bacterium]|nr:FAD-dependent monooxygenase [Ktedonobacteraceae bacterium]